MAERASRRRGPALALLVPLALIAAAVGWLLRGDGGNSVAKGPPPGAPAVTTAPAPDRAQVRLAVLNASPVSGLAHRTARRAGKLGYAHVTAGNSPATSGPSTAYYRPGARAAAQLVAKDLRVANVAALPATGPLTSAAPPRARVVVVLARG